MLKEEKVKPALRKIAKLRNCSAEEAREFCLEVQGLPGRPQSFASIAHAVEELGASASVEAVSEEAFRIHAETLKQRPTVRRRHRRRSMSPTPKYTPTPKYIIVDGVVRGLREWQKSEGIIGDGRASNR